MKKSKKTEQKIFEVATQLFLEKGVDRTSVREIATKAGINLALMNYYFRSKENLFDTIFYELVKRNSEQIKNTLNSELPLEEKITKYCHEYIDMLIENPLLVSFVMSILHRSPEKISEIKVVQSLYSTDVFVNQLMNESMKGSVRKVDPAHFFVDMISLIAFPFAIQTLIMDKNKMKKDDFKKYMQERKKSVPELLIRSLRP
ncbi:MAG: TetR/AcrR family transcriptional regulator [Bacteroidetes bacterium]|nr:TetR/AcrR family transcriptional regulator [Bacteroidota bacterium]